MTPLFCYEYDYNVVKHHSIDNMHSLYSGMTKTLYSLLFDGKAGDPWTFTKAQKREYGTHWARQKFPTCFDRSSRCINNNLKHFKSYEWRMLLLYGDPLVSLFGTQYPDKKKYLNFITRLSAIARVACSQRITVEQVAWLRVEELKWMMDFQRLFGSHYVTAIFHQLTHLHLSIRLFGPLWTTSMFPYENYNGCLTRHFHGSANGVSNACVSIAMRDMAHNLMASSQIQLQRKQFGKYQL